MPQGKFKQNKTKIPNSIKQKQKNKNGGVAFTRRSNAPIQPKKNKFVEAQKIKNVVSKVINKNAEEELRSRAVETDMKISQAQEAVIKHNKAMNNVASK